MADEILKRDQNSAVVLGGVTDDASQEIRMLRVDPVTNRLLISATGGGGFTSLDPTETPNGNLTVFTFSAATAQPSYILSDGVWMKAVSKAGTVNWTWASGPKQATMTIPPTDDIEGIV